MESSNYDIIDVSKFDDALGMFERIPRVKSPSGGDEQDPLCPKAVKEVSFRVADLFPAFSNDGVNDGLITDYLIDEYGGKRALGLSIEDTAYSLNMSSTLLKSLLSGEGLSLETFMRLIRSELFSRAELRARLLKDIKDSSGTTSWKTSLTLLEKLYPDEYGPRGGQRQVEDEKEPEWNINIVDPVVPAVDKETKDAKF